MDSFYLYLLILFGLVLFVKIIVTPKLIYEYPFFMGSMFLIFLVPQAIILYNNHLFFPAGVLQSTFLMCFLCLIMVVSGYHFGPSISMGSNLCVKLDDTKLQRIGIVFTIIGYVFSILINKYYTAHEAAGIEIGNAPTGIITIYFFFSTVINLAFPIFLYLAITTKIPFNVIMTVVAAAPTLYLIITGGRREPTALFLLSVGFILYYTRQIVPPRAAIIGLLLFATLFIPATGDYRNLSKRVGGFKAIVSLDLKKSFIEYYNSPITYKELNVAAHVVDSYLFSGDYEYGAGYWNVLIFRYVPAQIVGRDLKQTLQIGDGQPIAYRNGYNSPTGLTLTGIGDSFAQFGYLGCFFFFLQGGFFRVLWQIRQIAKGPLIQIFYIVCVVQALLSITHGTTNFFPGILFYFICLSITAKYAKINT